MNIESGGGALVISPNSIMYFNQNARYGISVNEYSSPLDLEPAYPLGMFVTLCVRVRVRLCSKFVCALVFEVCVCA